MKVAIMQPYFFPYAGYFRLFAAADIFVVLDCVQFPRRGWVHRNKLIDRNGIPQWLTLPLIKGSRDTLRICDLQFQPNIKQQMIDQFRRFRLFDFVETNPGNIFDSLLNTSQSPVDYLCETLSTVTNLLGLNRPIIRSSLFNLPHEIRSQERIIEIAKIVGAKHYINSPGGKNIYTSDKFSSVGMKLSFLSEYEGKYDSILQRILCEPTENIYKEIINNCSIN